MLSLEEKINKFKYFLSIKNENYADYMKDELYFYFFVNQNDMKFLNCLETEEQIEEKINFLTTKMIMFENLEGISEIINNYI